MIVLRTVCRVLPLAALLLAATALAQPTPPATPPAEPAPPAPPAQPAQPAQPTQPAQQEDAGRGASTEPAAPATAGVGPGGEAAARPAEAPATQPAPIAADPETLTKAKGHFKQGIAFASSGDCSAAIVEFQAAYAIIPRPNMLYNIAQCQERMFRYDLAVKYYDRYLAEAPADAPDRMAVEAALKTLGNLLGSVSITSNVPAQVWVGERLAGEAPGEAPGEVLLPAGRHTIELRAEGYIPGRQEVSIVGHDTAELTFKLVKAQTTIEVTETTGVPPYLFWSGVTATIAAGVVGGAFALQAQARFDDADALDRFDPRRAAAKSDIESSEFNADLSFAVAGALGLGTVIVAFMTDWDGEKRSNTEAAAAQATLKLSPVIAPGRLGLHLGGSL